VFSRQIKNAEIERFQAEVSDWEQREYFEMFERLSQRSSYPAAAVCFAQTA
jgi:hypothetical protein